MNIRFDRAAPFRLSSEASAEGCRRKIQRQKEKGHYEEPNSPDR
jgi:hypothetical protein